MSPAERVVRLAQEQFAAIVPSLREQFTGEISEFQPIATGVFSQAYAFAAGGRELILRVSRYDHSAITFASDDFAARHYASPAVPIPRILAIGTTGDEHWAVSERAPGQTVWALPPADRWALRPAMLAVFDAMARTDVSRSTGYGFWDATANGTSATWPEFLVLYTRNETTGYYRDWHALFDTAFLERDVFDRVQRRIVDLLPFCPTDRALIHNDLHFENVISDGRRITGVIDWGQAIYGDPLYEIARLIWWSGCNDYWYDGIADLLRDRYGATPHFAERILCYTCHVVLDDLRYYAKVGRRDDYVRFRDRLLTLIDK